MSANGGPPATLHGVLSVPMLADMVTDSFLIENNILPTELGIPAERDAFLDSILPLIPMGLQPIAFARRWRTVRFIDNQSLANGMLDTPLLYRHLVQNMELVHALHINRFGVYASTIHYGLAPQMLTGMHLRLPSLRTTLTHEFNFSNDDLQREFRRNNSIWLRLHARLSQWLHVIVNQPPTIYQIWVCVSDLGHSRDINDEHDVRNEVANNQLNIIAHDMLHHVLLGAVWRLR